MKKKRKRRELKCENFNRKVVGKGYTGISCKAVSVVIGFSNNPDKFYLSKNTFNHFIVEVEPCSARDFYINKFCRGKLCKECQFYK